MLIVGVEVSMPALLPGAQSWVLLSNLRFPVAEMLDNLLCLCVTCTYSPVTSLCRLSIFYLDCWLIG